MKLTSVVCLVAMTTAAVALASPEQAAITECNNKCKEQKDGTEATTKACQSGCTLYTQKESDRSFFGTGFFRDSNDIMVKCTNDCRSSYEDKKESSACSDGCHLMKDSSSRQDTVFNLADGGIRISFGRLPEMPRMSDLLSQVNNMVSQQHARIQSMFGNDDNETERMAKAVADPMVIVNTAPAAADEGGAFGGIFRTMQDQMKNMVQGLFNDNNVAASETGSRRDENGKLVHGGGELVVIKSGPGYHSKNTYHIGPNADIEKIMQETNMNDMMNHKNPIEQFLQRDQVEVFDPQVKEGNAEIIPSSIFGVDPWGYQFGPAAAAADKEKSVKAAPADNVNIGLEGPRLPETGLRSRHMNLGDGREVSNDEGRKYQVFRFNAIDKCLIMERSKMTWNQWFNCLHIRMGVPNWLLVATVALGVVFTLWLCLVIPTNAPKQKVRRPKNIDTKELEAAASANSVMVIQQQNAMLEKVDLPPSYEDIVCTKVESETKVKDEVKVVLCNDDDIVEPLPQKVSDEDRNCSNV